MPTNTTYHSPTVHGFPCDSCNYNVNREDWSLSCFCSKKDCEPDYTDVSKGCPDYDSLTMCEWCAEYFPYSNIQEDKYLGYICNHCAEELKKKGELHLVKCN